MSFLYPYAFLLLLAIPVLIIIYLLKNKYKEATAPSTYLWELSQRFMKRRNPLRTFEHLIALILQILTITALSICLAHPVITTPGKSDNILFVLDGSPSMRMEDENGSAFDKAKANILDIAQKSPKGSAFSLVYSGKEVRTVFQNVTNRNQLSFYLSSLKTENQTSDLTDSLSKAQEVIDNSNINLCYLLTDRKVDSLSNINLVDCSVEKDNYSISKLKYTYSEQILNIQASVLSHLSDQSLTVKFTVNGDEIGTRKYDVKKGESRDFSLEYKDLKDKYTTIDSVKAEIVDKDSLMDDNSMVVYNNSSVSTTKILLVSDKPFYFKSILAAIDRATDYKNTVTSVTSSYYNPKSSYDLYIFDSFTPETLPTEGSIFFFNSGATLEGTGFTYQKSVEASDAVHLTYSDNKTSPVYQTFTKGIAHNDIVVKKYMRYTLNQDFTTILSYNNLPFVFAGKTSNQQREVVFSFDLHDSNLPLLYDFTPLMRNALQYANPKILDSFAYEVGDETTFALSNNMKSFVITTPDGNKDAYQISDKDFLNYTLDQIGSYQINVVYQDGKEKTFNLFSRFSKEECVPHAEESNALTLNVDTSVKKGNGIFDNLLPIVICAIIFFLADWGVYAYEQY